MKLFYIVTSCFFQWAFYEAKKFYFACKHNLSARTTSSQTSLPTQELTKCSENQLQHLIKCSFKCWWVASLVKEKLKRSKLKYMHDLKCMDMLIGNC